MSCSNVVGESELPPPPDPATPPSSPPAPPSLLTRSSTRGPGPPGRATTPGPTPLPGASRALTLSREPQPQPPQPPLQPPQAPPKPYLGLPGSIGNSSRAQMGSRRGTGFGARSMSGDRMAAASGTAAPGPPAAAPFRVGSRGSRRQPTRNAPPPLPLPKPQPEPRRFRWGLSLR